MAASCRRSRFERLARVPAVYAFIAASILAYPALAADLPPSYCALDRAPTLDWLRLANGDDCPLDEDGNGLDDGVETALARCFVPEIAFDSRENALGPDEPHVVFSADPIAPRVIRLHFAVLFARDGGYTLGTEFPCLSDEHNGDSQAVTVDVVWLERDRRWYGAPLSMHTTGPDGSEERTALSGVAGNGSSGTHPRLYATAGKHHWLHRTASLTYACNCGPLGRCGSVRDRADGTGAHIVPASLRHAPRFAWRETTTAASNEERPRVRPMAPLDAAGRQFRNACAYRSRGVLTAAERSLGSNDLADLGFPGEHVFGACFRGGLGGPCVSTISVGEVLAWDTTPSTARARSEGGAGKLIASLLGIGGRAAPGASSKVKLLGRPTSRVDGVPSAVIGWSQAFESVQ
jgi:hypothetical protein